MYFQVSLSRRLAELKDRCQRSFRALEQSKLNTARRPDHRDRIHSSNIEEQLSRVQHELQLVKEELAQADNEIDDLEQELFEVQHDADRTPGALLFFAALQDDGAVPTMQQLVLQLGHLKSFVDGSEHLDFPTMRKRLQVCVECLPNLSKFIDKYSYLHQRWETNRKKAFAMRKLSGGDADSASLCILCNHDSRQSAPVNGGNNISCTSTTMNIHRSVERSSKLSRSLSHSVPFSTFSTSSMSYFSRPVSASVITAESSLSLSSQIRSSLYNKTNSSQQSNSSLPVLRNKKSNSKLK